MPIQKTISALIFLALSINLYALNVGEVPKTVIIQKDDGGVVDGSAWSSSMIKDKVSVLFYVDPDEKGVNEKFSTALKAKKYDRANYRSIAVVNLAATWKPNAIIESILKDKQKEFPDTVYVKDKNSVLVKEWGLADDSADVVIFDKKGKVLFYKAGKLSDDEIQKAFQLIEANL